MVPGRRQNASQMDGPLPSSFQAPSICAAAVETPQRKSSGNCRGVVIPVKCSSECRSLVSSLAGRVKSGSRHQTREREQVRLEHRDDADDGGEQDAMPDDGLEDVGFLAELMRGGRGDADALRV